MNYTSTGGSLVGFRAFKVFSLTSNVRTYNSLSYNLSTKLTFYMIFLKKNRAGMISLLKPIYPQIITQIHNPLLSSQVRVKYITLVEVTTPPILFLNPSEFHSIKEIHLIPKLVLGHKKHLLVIFHLIVFSTLQIFVCLSPLLFY